MPIGRGRSGGGVRLRPVSGMRGEGGGVLPRGAGASGALLMVLEAAGCGRRARVCLARFILRHAVAATSSSLSFSACLGDEEGLELLGCEFATKVAHEDGRESNLAIAWKLKVLAIIDARRTGEKPFFDGIWDVQPKSLSPNGAILGNMIRQGEEARIQFRRFPGGEEKEVRHLYQAGQ